MLVVSLVLIALVLGLNLVASVVVLNRAGLSPGNRAGQLLLVWLLPLVGAILCMAVATAEGAGGRGDGSGSYDASGGYPGDSHDHSHHSHHSDCSSDGGGGDGGSCSSD